MAQAKSSGWGIIGWIFAGVFGVILIGQCSKSPSTNSSVAAAPTPVITKYISARSLNCRTAPSSQSTVVRAFKQNETATVVEQAGDWTKLSGSKDCWVVSRYLADSAAPEPSSILSRADSKGELSGTQSLLGRQTSTSYIDSAPLKKSSSTRSRSSPRSYASSTSHRKSRKASSRGYGYDGGSCPCSGNRVCIGPRGGRYCITSGGNKRYGV